ncbi:xylose isomerase [Massilia sp. WF1]|uniref:sugar phosphate isomerase/epimerase family protein n=1 Tax=unclassified Massilia TaxID=2609279 RepID=UPI00064AE486|nr:MULTISPECIES: TIM barrel protein [unclassified Massilia]ALK95468.1 xylose isomerase [Massilia sp. WG5]KLU34954.1 xylose isomerase [Massilia sp. WF1]
MNPTHSIKRGVSLYSYQYETFLRKMSLDDCIAHAAGLGARGIEVVSEQSFTHFPDVPQAEIDGFFASLEKHGAYAQCHDMFLDTKLYKHRKLNFDEMVASMQRDLRFAHRLGCKTMRIIVNTPPEVVVACVPLAEELDIRMGIEVHSPFHFDHPWILRYTELTRATGSDHVGYVPDMGMYIKDYPPVFRDRFLRMGATPKIVEFILEAHKARVLPDYVLMDIRKMGANQVDLGMAETLRHNIWSNPRRMLEFMPWIFHIHAKFYEIDDTGKEPSIPYDEIIPVLIEGGYTGHLSSEYEGQRHIEDAFEVDGREQVRRQQEMFKRLLGEA